MQAEDKVKILSDLVSFDSRNGGERPVAEYLKKVFDEHGITSTVLPLSVNGDDRANLVAEIGSGKPVIGFTGHMDIVDYNAADWDTDPLQLTEKDGNLYGRGASDMKSGLAAMVLAMLELKEHESELNGTIRLLATAGEEVGMNGSEELEAQGYMEDVSALVVGEPTGYRAAYASKGELNITLKSQGKAAHSSMPQFGINAVQQLIDVWNKIYASLEDSLPLSIDEDLGQTLFNLDVIQGGTQPNVIPENAEAEINIRTTPGFANDKLEAVIAKDIELFNESAQGEITSEVTMDIVPVKGDKDSVLIQSIKSLAEEHGVTDLPIVAMPGGCDASRLLLHKEIGFPVAVFGPGVPKMAHQANEYCTEQVYFDFIDIYPKLMVKMLDAMK